MLWCPICRRNTDDFCEERCLHFKALNSLIPMQDIDEPDLSDFEDDEDDEDWREDGI